MLPPAILEGRHTGLRTLEPDSESAPVNSAMAISLQYVSSEKTVCCPGIGCPASHWLIDVSDGHPFKPLDKAQLRPANRACRRGRGP
jgi:hypothetical protein